MAERPFRMSRATPPALDLRAHRIPAGQGSSSPGQIYSGPGLQPDIPPADQATLLEEMRTRLNDAQFALLLKAIRKQGHMIMKPIVVGVTAINLLPQQEGRYYLLLINTSGVNRMFVGLDVQPQANLGIPLEINFGFWEPWVVPDNEINILAAGAGTTGVCVYASL